MSDNELLSKDEIDALLHGVGNGDIETETGEIFAGEVRAYDFSSHERIARDRLPALEGIHARFARSFAASLSDLIRRRTSVAVSNIQRQKFSAFVHGLPVPTSLNVIRLPPLRGRGLLVLDRELIFSIVDSFFGGSGNPDDKSLTGDFTAAELRIISQLLELGSCDLKAAWQPVLDIDFEQIESAVDPRFVNVASPSEIVLVATFHVELEAGGGDLSICLPYFMLESIGMLLGADVQCDPDENWEASLRDEILNVKLELKGSMAETTLSVQELAKLEIGEIVPVDLHEMVDVLASGVPVFKGEPGTSSGKYAVKVKEWMRGDK